MSDESQKLTTELLIDTERAAREFFKKHDLDRRPGGVLPSPEMLVGRLAEALEATNDAVRALGARVEALETYSRKVWEAADALANRLDALAGRVRMLEFSSGEDLAKRVQVLEAQETRAADTLEATASTDVGWPVDEEVGS